MKDLHIAVSAEYDLQMSETLSGVKVYAEDDTDVVMINLTATDAEQIYNWLGEYLGK
jgi:hypothetical protein